MNKFVGLYPPGLLVGQMMLSERSSTGWSSTPIRAQCCFQYGETIDLIKESWVCWNGIQHSGRAKWCKDVLVGVSHA